MAPVERGRMAQRVTRSGARPRSRRARGGRGRAARGRARHDAAVANVGCAAGTRVRRVACSLLAPRRHQPYHTAHGTARRREDAVAVARADAPPAAADTASAAVAGTDNPRVVNAGACNAHPATVAASVSVGNRAWR